MEGVSLIAGLGNPGARYQPTRHNAGYWFVEALAARHGASFKAAARYHGEVAELNGAWLLKPGTFMNRSGQAVAALAGFYKIPVTRILVVHDDLDLPPGTARLKQGGGHGGHNGLRSLMADLGSGDFWRLRLGIGHPGHKDGVSDYVLSKPSQEDRVLIEDALDRALAVMPDLRAGLWQAAMQALHSAR